MKSTAKIAFVIILNCWLSIVIAFAQSNEDFIVPRTNSQSTITQTIASTLIEVSYNRPNKKGRQIFGGLVPYGEVWRTGADESTKIYFSTPVSINGEKLDSGNYELFTIPNQNTWVLIFQKNNNQWGSYKYNADHDVLRVKADSKDAPFTEETFSMSFKDVHSNSGLLQLAWDMTTVEVEIEVDLLSTVVPKLEEALKSIDHPPYFQAAMFYYDNEIDINRADELMKEALMKNTNHIGMLYRHALILRDKGDIQGAILASKKSLNGAQSMSQELKTEYTKLNEALLQELK